MSTRRDEMRAVSKSKEQRVGQDHLCTSKHSRDAGRNVRRPGAISPHCYALWVGFKHISTLLGTEPRLNQPKNLLDLAKINLRKIYNSVKKFVQHKLSFFLLVVVIIISQKLIWWKNEFES